MSDADGKMARILARAVQMQETRDEDERLAQLEDAAAEVGIDRALVRRAAWEHELDNVEPPRALGIPTRVVRRRWIDADVTNPQVRAELLSRLDVLFGAQGERTEDERHATWTARHIVVTFESRDGSTLVQMSERFVNTANASFGLGAALGLAAGSLGAVVTLASLGKGLLAGLLAGPVVLLGIGLGVLTARARLVRTLANTAATFEQVLTSLDAAPTTKPRALKASEAS